MSIRRLTELHVVRARTEALHIFAFAGAVYPAEWQDKYVEEIVAHLFDFSFHARRINQLCDFRDVDFGSIHTLILNISEGDPGDWESNYHFALNRLAHTADFIFGNAHADHRRIFLKSEANLIPMYVKVRTDEHQSASISLYGLVDCFLFRVIPEIRSRFPEYQF